MSNLKNAIESIHSETKETIKDKNELAAELKQIFIRQFDVTQDISGFVMFSTKLTDKGQIEHGLIKTAELLG